MKCLFVFYKRLANFKNINLIQNLLSYILKIILPALDQSITKNQIKNLFDDFHLIFSICLLNMKIVFQYYF